MLLCNFDDVNGNFLFKYFGYIYFYTGKYSEITFLLYRPLQSDLLSQLFWKDCLN